MKIMICWNRSWVYNCPVPWYTVRRRNVCRRIVVEPFFPEDTRRYCVRV